MHMMTKDRERSVGQGQREDGGNAEGMRRAAARECRGRSAEAGVQRQECGGRSAETGVQRQDSLIPPPHTLPSLPRCAWSNRSLISASSAATCNAQGGPSHLRCARQQIGLRLGLGLGLGLGWHLILLFFCEWMGPAANPGDVGLPLHATQEGQHQRHTPRAPIGHHASRPVGL